MNPFTTRLTNEEGEIMLPITQTETKTIFSAPMEIPDDTLLKLDVKVDGSTDIAKEASASVTEISKTVEGQNDRIGKAEAAVQGQNTKIEELEASAEDADSKLYEHGLTLNVLSETVAWNRQKSDEADTELNSQITSHDGRIAALETSTKATDGKVTKLETDLGALSPKVTKNAADITELDGRVDAHDTSISSLDSSVKTLNTQMTSVTSKATTNETNISSLTKRVTTNEGNITSQGTRIGTLETKVANLNVKQFEIEVDGSAWTKSPGSDLKTQFDAANANRPTNQKFTWAIKVANAAITDAAVFNVKAVTTTKPTYAADDITNALDPMRAWCEENNQNCGIDGYAVANGALYLFSARNDTEMQMPGCKAFDYCLKYAYTSSGGVCTKTDYMTACLAYANTRTQNGTGFTYLPCMLVRRPYGGKMKISFSQLVP